MLGYFEWMSDNNDRLTRDRLKMILRHTMQDQDEVIVTIYGKNTLPTS